MVSTPGVQSSVQTLIYPDSKISGQQACISTPTQKEKHTHTHTHTHNMSTRMVSWCITTSNVRLRADDGAGGWEGGGGIVVTRSGFL